MLTIPRSPRFNIELIIIDKEVRLLDLFNMVYPLVVVFFFKQDHLAQTNHCQIFIVQGDKIPAQMKNVDVQMLNVNFEVGQAYVI